MTASPQCENTLLASICHIHAAPLSQQLLAYFGSIRDECRVLMQWMKSDTAATGIVYRICEKVIEIDNHRRNHRNPCLHEVLSKEHAGHGGRYQEVQEQVNDRSDHSVCPGRKKAAQKLGGH